MRAKLISADGLEKIMEIPDGTTDWRMVYLSAPRPAYDHYHDNIIKYRTYRLEQYDQVPRRYKINERREVSGYEVRYTTEEIETVGRIAIFREVVADQEIKPMTEIRVKKDYEIMQVNNMMDGIE